MTASIGEVTVTMADLDGRFFDDMRFWDEFCPYGTHATRVRFMCGPEAFLTNTVTVVVGWERTPR